MLLSYAEPIPTVVESADVGRGDREIAVRVGLDHKTFGGIIIARSRLSLLCDAGIDAETTLCHNDGARSER